VDKFRLVTRSDFDGLVCAVLLKHLDMIDEIKFVHPKDMQDGKVDIGARDITTNLPYVHGAHLVFDHHASETIRHTTRAENYVIDAEAASAARVVYEHFGGPYTFPSKWGPMMAAVDKADSARFSREEILEPHGWVLLNYLMDPRTGLGRFRDFRISNYQLMMDLIEACRTLEIDDIMRLPDVQERVELYMSHQPKFKEQLVECSRVHGNVVVIDLRDQETIFAGNRFTVYALFPETNISVHALWGVKRQNTVFAVGKSILNRTSTLDIGELMLRHGGGGHANAGTCQVANENAAAVLDQIVGELRSAK
jgi:nanoRNase/pAp phosphatase (c-di-AMP/oligoRNAs hydrolase)